jgi:hypothetical protein
VQRIPPQNWAGGLVVNQTMLSIHFPV